MFSTTTNNADSRWRACNITQSVRRCPCTSSQGGPAATPLRWATRPPHARPQPAAALLPGRQRCRRCVWQLRQAAARARARARVYLYIAL